MSEQNTMLNPTLNHIQYFVKNYEEEKYNLRIDKFNKNDKILTIAYRKYVEKYVLTYTTYNPTNVKITQFKIIVELNENFNKINSLEFMDNNGKSYTINNKKIKAELMNKLEKDLVTIIGYKKSSIRSIIDYNYFINIFNSTNNNEHRHINNDNEEKLSLLNNAIDCFNEIAINTPSFN